MGCQPTRLIKYNRQYRTEEHGSDVFVNNNVEHFEEIEDFFEDKSYLHEFLYNSFKFYYSRDCLGYFKEQEHSQDNNYVYFKYEEVINYAVNINNNIKDIINFNNNSKDNDKEDNELINLEENSFRNKLIGIFSRNCVEYLIADLACQIGQFTSVPILENILQNDFYKILTRTELTTLCISENLIESLYFILKQFHSTKNLRLKNIIVFDLTTKIVEREKLNLLEIDFKFNIFLFTDLIKSKENNDLSIIKNKEIAIDQIPHSSNNKNKYNYNTKLNIGRNLEDIKSNEIVSLIYDFEYDNFLEISQKNLLASIYHINDCGYFNLSDDFQITMASFMSLATLSERSLILNTLLRGGKVGFINEDLNFEDIFNKTKGSIEFLLKKLRLIKPTFIHFNNFYAKLFRQFILHEFNKYEEGYKKKQIFKALAIKRDNFTKSHVLNDSFFDTFIFNYYQKLFGGNIKLIMLSNLVSKQIKIDLSIFLSAPVVQFYSTNLCTGIGSLSHKTEINAETHLGGLISGMKIKLVPYFNKHNPINVEFKDQLEDIKYYENYKLLNIKGPAVHDKKFTKIGANEIKVDWVKTNEIVYLLDNISNNDNSNVNNNNLENNYSYSLKLHGKANSLIRLSNRKFINLDYLESIYVDSVYILQICIIQINESNFKGLNAIVNLDKDFTENLYLKKENIEIAKEEMYKIILKDLNDNIGLTLPYYEKIDNLIESSFLFTVENNFLFYDFSLNREKIKNYFFK